MGHFSANDLSSALGCESLFLLVSVINMIAFIRWSSDKTCQLGWVLVKKYETILKKKYGRTHKTPTKQSAATNFMNHLHLPNTHNCDVLAWLEAERRAAPPTGQHWLVFLGRFWCLCEHLMYEDWKWRFTWKEKVDNLWLGSIWNKIQNNQL